MRREIDDMAEPARESSPVLNTVVSRRGAFRGALALLGAAAAWMIPVKLGWVSTKVVLASTYPCLSIGCNGYNYTCTYQDCALNCICCGDVQGTGKLEEYVHCYFNCNGGYIDCSYQ